MSHVGTALEVAPASWLVMSAPAYGAVVILIDPDPPLKAQAVASVVVPAAAERALPELVEIARDSLGHHPRRPRQATDR